VFVTRALSGKNYKQTLQTARQRSRQHKWRRATLVLPPSSFLPPSSCNCTSNLGRKNPVRVSKMLLFNFFYFFEIELVWNCVNFKLHKSRSARLLVRLYRSTACPDAVSSPYRQSNPESLEVQPTIVTMPVELFWLLCFVGRTLLQDVNYLVEWLRSFQSNEVIFSFSNTHRPHNNAQQTTTTPIAPIITHQKL